MIYAQASFNYAYDNNGNLAVKQDARGVVANYIYDALNRVTSRTYTGSVTPAVSYFYDGTGLATVPANSKGQLTKVASSVSETRYTLFDEIGRIKASQQITDGVTYDFADYTYNLAGALIEQTYPSTRVVKNVLDNDGDLSMVQSKKNASSGFSNYATNFTYTAAGAVSSMKLGNNRWESTQFNSRLQPIQIALGATQNATNLLKLDYEYGTLNASSQTISGTNNGNISKQFITAPAAGQTPGFTATQYYDYDELNRLYQASDQFQATGQANVTAWWQTYKYDRYGNRRFNEQFTTTIPAGCLTAVCNPTIDPATNRLVGYGFDNAGNTTTDAEGKTFTYDAENKQTQVKNADQIPLGTYFYDGDGKRVKKVAGTETTIFVYDAGGKMVAEYSTTVAPASEAKVSYLTTDHLGSPRIITDATGGVISRRDFMPFGEEVPRAGYGSDQVRQKFTAYERDIESDLDFAQARYYSSRLGRFYSVDPENYGAHTDDAQSWNGYNYGRSNPLVYSDPEGLEYLICSTGQEKRECYRHNDADVHKSMREGLLFYDGTKSPKNGLRSGVIRNENGDVIASYQQISHDDPIQAMLWGAKPVLDIWQTPVEMAQPAPIPGGGVIGTTAKVGTKGAKGFVLGSKIFKSSGFVGRALEKLGLAATKGSGKEVLEVVGTSDDALMLFNELRGTNKVRMVAPNKWVAESASGSGTTITFRRGGGNAIRSRTNAAVDAPGVEPGIKKIHFK